MRKLCAVIVFALAFAGLQVRNSAAATVIVAGNFVNGDTYDTSEGWEVTGPSSLLGSFGYNYEVAMSFEPSQDCTLVAADLAVSYNSGTNSLGSLDVTLMDNNSGVPGATTLDTFTLNTEMGPIGDANAPLQAVPATSLTLDVNDTYWLVVSATSDTYAIWNDSLSDTSGGAHQNLSDPGWSFYPDTSTAAFSITGTPAPEPASIVFFSTGTLAVIGFYLARKRQSAKCSG
jgi:hypothetical protein